MQGEITMSVCRFYSFFFSSRRRHTRFKCDWSSDVCSSDLYINASWTKGSHAIKFGVDIATTEDYTYSIGNAFGSYTYQTVNAFALDFSGNTTGAKNWQRYSQTFGNPVVDATINDYGFYLEDQWRATGKLTLNFGARYEYAHLPQPQIFNHDYSQTGHILSGPIHPSPRPCPAHSLNHKTLIRPGLW